MNLGEMIKSAQIKLGLDTAQVASACSVGKDYINGLKRNSKAHSVSPRLADELIGILKLENAQPAIKAHNKRYQAYRLSQKEKKIGIKAPKESTPAGYTAMLPAYFVMTRANYGKICFHLEEIQKLLKETTC